MPKDDKPPALHGVSEADFRFVETNGEQFVDWEPEWTPEEEGRIEAGVDELRRSNTVIRFLRRALELTQAECAEILGVTQSNVSKLEQSLEPRLSVVQKLVEHKGGRLRLLATFDGLELELPISLVAPIHPSKDQSVPSKASPIAPRRKDRSRS